MIKIAILINKEQYYKIKIYLETIQNLTDVQTAKFCL